MAGDQAICSIALPAFAPALRECEFLPGVEHRKFAQFLKIVREMPITRKLAEATGGRGHEPLPPGEIAKRRVIPVGACSLAVQLCKCRFRYLGDACGDLA